MRAAKDRRQRVGARGAMLAASVSLAAACAGPRAASPPPADAAPAPVEAAAPRSAAIPPFTDAAAAKLKADVEVVLAEHTFGVPVSARRPVLKVIHHLQHHPDARLLMEASLANAPTYQGQIQASLRRDGLPPELFYVAEAESAFVSPDLKGKGLAVGLWQMIPSTARHYGLKVDDKVDERADAFKSTDASMRHLVDLFATFNDWELVITGFYAGAGIVERGIEIAGTREAWALIEASGPLPEETRGYLPLVYAHAVISQDPGRFGFTGRVSEADERRLLTEYGHFYTNRYPMDLFAP